MNQIEVDEIIGLLLGDKPLTFQAYFAALRQREALKRKEASNLGCIGDRIGRDMVLEMDAEFIWSHLSVRERLESYRHIILSTESVVCER
jgi:hypothetical protein